MLADSDLYGFSTAMNIQDFVEGYAGTQSPEAFYMCFADVVARCAALGVYRYPSTES